jgi:hypothetical protein
VATETFQVQLERVQAAIKSIEDRGQAIDESGNSLTRADLRVLYAREDRLRSRVARAKRGGMRMKRIVPRDV